MAKQNNEPLMTEQQFIAKFKKEGFGLYKTSEIKKMYKRIESAHKHLSEILKPY